MSSERVRAAVVGVGYLGAFHAEKYATLPGVELIGVVDSDAQRAAAIARTLHVPALAGVEALFGRVDCASIAVSTPGHYAVAAALLEHGVDVLVEKPITATLPVQSARWLTVLSTPLISSAPRSRS